MYVCSILNGSIQVLCSAVLLIVLCTRSIYLYQWSGFSTQRLVSIGIIIICWLSTWPFPLGTPVAIIRCWIISDSQNSWNLFDVNAERLSLRILSGFPNTAACRLSRSITSSVPVLLVGHNHTNLEKASTTTIHNSLLQFFSYYYNLASQYHIMLWSYMPDN